MNANDRLNRLCDRSIEQLQRGIDWIKAIKNQDAASANAAAFLKANSRFIPYDGEYFGVSVESIFSELEEMDADKTFGPRSNNGEEQMCSVCGKSGNTAHDLTWDERVNGWVCDNCEMMELTESADGSR